MIVIACPKMAVLKVGVLNSVKQNLYNLNILLQLSKALAR